VQDKAALAKAERGIKGILDAIEDGRYQRSMLDRLDDLEKEKDRIEARLKRAPELLPRIHPNIAEIYRAKVAKLEEALGRPEDALEAAEAMRALIEKIILTPGASRGEVNAELHGELASILALTSGQKPRMAQEVQGMRFSVVADLLPMSKGKKRHCWAVTQQQRPFLLERSAVLGPFQNKPALPVSQSDILDRVCARHSAKWQVGTKGWSRAVEQRDGSIRPRRSVLPGMMHRIPSAVPARCTRP
jgi:hypothetical protein